MFPCCVSPFWGRKLRLSHTMEPPPPLLPDSGPSRFGVTRPSSRWAHTILNSFIGSAHYLSHSLIVIKTSNRKFYPQSVVLSMGPSLAMSLSRPLDRHYSHIFKTGPVPVAPLQHVPPARRTHPRLLQRQRSPAGFLRHRRQRRGYEGPEGPIRRKSAHSLSEEASAK